MLSNNSKRDGGCSLDSWMQVSNSWVVCRVHNVTFPISERCPRRSESPSVPVEKGFSNGVDNSGFHKQFISNDKQFISSSNSVSKRKYVKKNRDSLYERFHNHGVKFDAVVDWDLVDGKIVFINSNSKYKRLDFSDAIVKVFKRSILVTLRSSAEIVHYDVRTAELDSIKKIVRVLDQLPKCIVVSNPDVVNLHNSFVNHPLGKRDLNVKVNDEVRFISDHSKGLNEFEAVHPKFAVSDSEKIEEDIVSLVDKGLSRDFLASSLNSLIEDRRYYAEHIKSHVGAIQTLGSSVGELKEVIKDIQSQHSSTPSNSIRDVEASSRDSSGATTLTISSDDSPEVIEDKKRKLRQKQAKKLLSEWGWGESLDI